MEVNIPIPWIQWKVSGRFFSFRSNKYCSSQVETCHDVIAEAGVLMVGLYGLTPQNTRIHMNRCICIYLFIQMTYLYIVFTYIHIYRWCSVTSIFYTCPSWNLIVKPFRAIFWGWHHVLEVSMVQVPNLEDRRSDLDNSQTCVFPNFHDFCFFHYACFGVAVIFAYTFHYKKCSTHPGSKVYKLFQLKLSASRILVVHHKGFVNILSNGRIICFEMIQFICISTLSLLARCWFCAYIFHQSRLGIYIYMHW